MIKLVTLKKTCLACPSQWEGETDKGEVFYIRYRWGRLKMYIDDVLVYDEQIGDDIDGFMDTDEMVKILNLNVDQKLIEANLFTYEEMMQELQRATEKMKKILGEPDEV